MLARATGRLLARGLRHPATRALTTPAVRRQATFAGLSAGGSPRFSAATCPPPSGSQGWRRRLCAAASQEPKIVQELPSRLFWHDTFPDLTALSDDPRHPEGKEKAEVVKWAKKPREAVKKGDLLFELEVAGSILLEMRADVDGFMGPQLVPEGTFLEEGAMATYLTKEPEKMPEVSKKTEAELMDQAGGSVRQLKEGLEDIHKRREEVRSAIVYAMRLSAVHCVCDPSSTAMAARVPGDSDHMFAQPYVMLPQEMTKDSLVEVNVLSGSLIPAPEESAPAAEGSSAARFQEVLSAVLRVRDDVECVILAQPMAATTLGMLKIPGIANIFSDPASVSLELARACNSGGKVSEETVKSAMQGRNAVILPGFGVLVVGRSVAETYTRLVAMEKASKMTLGALQTGMKLDDIVPLHDPPKARDAEIDFAALVRSIKKGVHIAAV